MQCPHYGAAKTNPSGHKTALGYRTCRCSDGKHRFNERTATPFTNLPLPTAVVRLVVLWWLRYKLSPRDRAEMFLVRGLAFTHETGRDWVARCAPRITPQLRAKRQGKVGGSWRVDEAYVRIAGRGHYLYRAIDRAGNLVDSLLSKTRDMAAAKQFFKGAKKVTGCKPQKVTTDGHNSYPLAIRSILGRKVLRRTNRYLNNRIEQDHRGMKQRYYPMRGLGNFAGAARFCRACDEQRSYFRARTKPKETVSMAEQRRVFRQRFAALQESLIAA
jgi:transposase-like protein